jgi:integrase
MTEIGFVRDEPEVIIRVMLNADRAIDDFIGDCRRLGWSERSIATYERTLFEFADRLPRDYDVDKINDDDVRRYLATKRHLAPGTVAGIEAHLSSWLKWLYLERKIARNPMDRLARTRRVAAEDLDVVSIDTDGVRLLLAESRRGGSWAECNATHIACYLGPRRKAIAGLRASRDYDPATGMIRFREKGAKIIWKPAPHELRGVLDASLAAGAIHQPPYDYLVPPEGYLDPRKTVRDDRVIWRVIKRVADRAGVPVHVHALRAAFACFYLEQNPDDLIGLKELLGHRSIQTTLVYLRRLNKQTRMERVRSLSYAVADADDGAAVGFPQRAGIALASSSGVGARGFEPLLPSIPDPDRPDRQPPGEVALLEAIEQRLKLLREELARKESQR